MTQLWQQTARAATRKGIWQDRRASITILVAVALPVMAIMAGIGVEVSQWALASSRLQRAADSAAVAGAKYYAASANASKAAGVAADTAEINGGVGATTRSWSSSTQKLTDGSIIVTLGAGISNASYTSVSVTVTQTMTPSFTGALNVGARTITATATADAVPSSSTSEACLVALGTGDTDDVDDDDEPLGSHSAVNLLGCSIRSNKKIRFEKDDNINASDMYSEQDIDISGSTKITATTLQGNLHNTSSNTVTGTVKPPVIGLDDPYKNNTALNAAFAKLTATGKTSLELQSSTHTLNPGTWSSWNFHDNAKVILNPGLYVVTGAITCQQTTTVSGSGVTIVHGGGFSMDSSSKITVTAPGTSPTGGAVPAVALAGNTSTGTISFAGTNNASITGVIYYPNTTVHWAGSTVSGSSGCLQLMAKRITLAGSNSQAASCASYGAATTTTGTVSTGKLVQ